MLNTLIFLDDNYHSISTFPNVSSIKQLKQHFYYIWNKLENGIFYSCNPRSTYIKHCVSTHLCVNLVPLFFPSASRAFKAFSFIHSSLWKSQYEHVCEIYNFKTKCIPPPIIWILFLLMRIQIANKIGKPCFTDEMCLCVVWMLWSLAAYKTGWKLESSK